MEEKKDYYAILGITEEEKKLPQEEFEKVARDKFRKLSIKEHPDRWSKSDEKERKLHEDKFKEINEAYSILSDEAKRNEYDNGGRMFNPFGDDFFNGFGFDFNFGGFGRPQQPIKRGEDLRIMVKVTLEDVLQGSTKKVAVRKKKQCLHCHKEKCPQCNGTGVVKKNSGSQFMQVITQTVCPHCHGTGFVSDPNCQHCHGNGFIEETVEENITIPKGVDNNMQFSIQGHGNEYLGVGSGENGDLVVLIKVEEHERFDRYGNTLMAKLPLSIKDALTGCNVDFTCLDGKRIKVTIPPLTKNGKQFSLTGKGLPSITNGIVGPLVLDVEYVMPKSPLTDRQIELLTEFEKIETEKI